ncbi:MAG: ABC transporter permease subunit [Thermoplasmatota archaeon]
MHVMRREFIDARVALIGWAVALVGLVVLLLAVYPTIHAQAGELQKLIDTYPPGIKALYGGTADFGTGAGYLRAEFFSLMLPLLLAIFGIGRAASSLAGEEERGALDVVLSLALTRRRVLLEKAAILLLALAGYVALLFVGLAVADVALAMGVPVLTLARALAATFLLAASLAFVALAAAAWTGRRGLSIAIGSAVATVAYLLDVVGKLAPDLGPLRNVSFFAFYASGEPSVGGWIALVIVPPALLACALVGFERRDLRA